MILPLYPFSKRYFLISFGICHAKLIIGSDWSFIANKFSSECIGIRVPGTKCPILRDPGFSNTASIIFSSKLNNLTKIAALPGKALARSFPCFL